jgi:hypothetical protein
MASKLQKLLTVIIIITLLASIAYTSIPNAKAAELTSQQKTISTLSNVVGIDTSKYNVSVTQSPGDLYRDTLPRENIRTILDAEGSKLDTLCTFINGSLQKIYVCANEGSPRMNTLSTSDIGMAQNFLTNYQAQSRNPFYGQLNSILAKADATKNSSTTVGNIKLNVTVLEKDTTFQWTYVANGIEAPDKSVALRYTNGFLNYFIDNWNLYKVGSTNVNLSEKDAINIAMTRAKNYSPDSSENGTIGGIKFNVTNALVIETFLAPSVYADANYSRSEDPLELYPMYNVWVSLDKFYSGNVYGFNVYIWADTKEVYYIHQRVSTIDPPAELVASSTESTQSSGNQTAILSTVLNSNNSLSIASIMLPACAAAILIVIPVYLSIKKKTSSSFLRLPKTRCLKVGGILLCLLIFSPVLIAMSASPVAAANVGGASVWGAESVGSINYGLNPPESWRKTNSEVTWQRNTAAYIDGLFDANGYVSTNNQGSHNYGSNKGAVLDQIYYFETNYPRVAVVDFDHGNGKTNTGISGAPSDEFHYMFEDNWGTREGSTYNSNDSNANEHAIFDSDIYTNTVTGKTCFAFINTCNSAHVNDSGIFWNWTVDVTQGLVGGSRARGMAYAWSHGIKVTATPTSTPPSGWMSRNGYSYADSGSFCFIGFESGSAALDQTIDNSDYHYYYWVYHFFYYALACDYTIHTALDLASQDTFYGSPNFDASPLSNSIGFTAIWPMYRNGQWDYQDYSVPNCHMRVYGNSYIQLYQPLLTLSCVDNNNNPLYSVFTLDGQAQSPGSVRVVPKNYVVNVNDIPNYAFSYFSYNGQNYGRGASIPLTTDGQLIAHYNWSPVYYNLAISSSGPGYTTPTGNQQYLSNTYAQVQAYPNSGYIHYWTSDLGGDPDYNPTRYVLMNGAHWVQANFVAAPSYNFVSHVESSSGSVSNPTKLNGPNNDGQYATIEGWGPYQIYGTIATHLYFTTLGHIYVYGCASYCAGPLYVYTSVDGSNWNLISTPFVSQGSPGWIDCGYSLSSFSYIMFTAEDWNYIYSISIDSVHVEP